MVNGNMSNGKVGSEWLMEILVGYRTWTIPILAGRYGPGFITLRVAPTIHFNQTILSINSFIQQTTENYFPYLSSSLSHYTPLYIKSTSYDQCRCNLIATSGGFRCPVPNLCSRSIYVPSRKRYQNMPCVTLLFNGSILIFLTSIIYPPLV